MSKNTTEVSDEYVAKAKYVLKKVLGMLFGYWSFSRENKENPCFEARIIFDEIVNKMMGMGYQNMSCIYPFLYDDTGYFGVAGRDLCYREDSIKDNYRQAALIVSVIGSMLGYKADEEEFIENGCIITRNGFNFTLDREMNVEQILKSLN
jgi:hypothetical protein